MGLPAQLPDEPDAEESGTFSAIELSLYATDPDAAKTRSANYVEDVRAHPRRPKPRPRLKTGKKRPLTVVEPAEPSKSSATCEQPEQGSLTRLWYRDDSGTWVSVRRTPMPQS